MANMNGQPVVQHGGADSAHRSMLMYFPEIDAAVITQSNNAGFNSKMAATIAKIFLAEHFVDKPKAEGDSAKAEFDPKTFDAESFGQFEGKFELDEVPGFIMSFTREKDKFYTQATGQPKLEIVPTGPNRFKLLAVEASVTFNKNDKNKYDSLTLNQNGEHNAKRIKEEPWKPDAKQLAAYSGTFFSTELESFYRIKVEDNSLVIKQRRSPEAVKLNPVKAHEFVAPKMGRSKFKFESGEKGVVSGFTLGNGRTKGVKFTRFKLD